MKNIRMMTSLVVLAITMTVLAPGASAQDGSTLTGADVIQAAAVARVGGDLDPDQFGTNWFTKVIPVSAFQPEHSSHTFTTSALYRYSTTAASGWFAFLDVPSGTEIQQVCLFVYDGSSTADIQLSWKILRLGDSTETVGITPVASGQTDTAAMPGYTTVCIGTGSPVSVSDFADVDGDGDSEYNKHFVSLNTPNSTALGWGGLLVQWRRVISPAPTSATFPNDVPTTHPFFRFIEALGASGITAGCGAGSYCPDNQLTRGEMAVFMTKALGLYWPQ